MHLLNIWFIYFSLDINNFISFLYKSLTSIIFFSFSRWNQVNLSSNISLLFLWIWLYFYSTTMVKFNFFYSAPQFVYCLSQYLLCINKTISAHLHFRNGTIRYHYHSLPNTISSSSSLLIYFHLTFVHTLDTSVNYSSIKEISLYEHLIHLSVGIDLSLSLLHHSLLYHLPSISNICSRTLVSYVSLSLSHYYRFLSWHGYIFSPIHVPLQPHCEWTLFFFCWA